jgi:hypothetical protein
MARWTELDAQLATERFLKVLGPARIFSSR